MILVHNILSILLYFNCINFIIYVALYPINKFFIHYNLFKIKHIHLYRMVGIDLEAVLVVEFWIVRVSYKARSNGGVYVLYWFNRWPFHRSKYWPDFFSIANKCKNRRRDVIFKQDCSKNLYRYCSFSKINKASCFCLCL